MSASFSMRETLEGGNFTWTSAGPTADGDIGEDDGQEKERECFFFFFSHEDFLHEGLSQPYTLCRLILCVPTGRHIDTLSS